MNKPMIWISAGLMLVFNLLVAFMFVGSFMFFLYPLIGPIELVLILAMGGISFMNNSKLNSVLFWILICLWIVVSAYIPFSLIMAH